MKEDVKINFRHFQPEDIDQVKVIFAEGMWSLFPVAFKLNMSIQLASLRWNHPLFLAAPIVAAAWQKTETSNRNLSTLLSLYVAATIVAIFASLVFYYVMMRIWFSKYITESIETDLSNIPTVYQDRGCFLVATILENDNGKKEKVVGIVGGEFKEKDDKGKNVYELRRMSVNSEVRKRGIGKRLVQRLEQELSRVSKIFLHASNLQPAAHALYKSQGFQIKNEKKLSETCKIRVCGENEFCPILFSNTSSWSIDVNQSQHNCGKEWKMTSKHTHNSIHLAAAEERHILFFLISFGM